MAYDKLKSLQEELHYKQYVELKGLELKFNDNSRNYPKAWALHAAPGVSGAKNE